MVNSWKKNIKCLVFRTARCINFKSMPIVQSRNQRDAAARGGNVGPIVASRGTNRSATVGAPAMETVAIDAGIVTLHRKCDGNCGIA